MIQITTEVGASRKVTGATPVEVEVVQISFLTRQKVDALVEEE